MIKRKKKRCKECKNDRYLKGRGLCSYCYAKEYTKRNGKKKRNYQKKVKRKRSTPTERQRKIKAIDRDFSLLIRALNSSKGMVICFTCDKVMLWKGGKGVNRAENGHLFSRKSLCLRWDKKNCEPQCNYCNSHLSGNYEVFKDRYINKYGQQQYDKITLTFHQKICKYNITELETIHKEIRKELNGILKRKNL